MIIAQNYLTMKRKLAFSWLIVFVTMTTPIFSHKKDKNDMFTSRGEIKMFREEESLRGTSRSTIHIPQNVTCLLYNGPQQKKQKNARYTSSTQQKCLEITSPATDSAICNQFHVFQKAAKDGYKVEFTI